MEGFKTKGHMVQISEGDFNHLVWGCARAASKDLSMAMVKDGHLIVDNSHHLTDPTIRVLRDIFTSSLGEGNGVYRAQCYALVGFLDSECLSRGLKGRDLNG